MKTIYWILIGVGSIAIAIIGTRALVKVITKRDEEDIIDEAVERIMFGRGAGVGVVKDGNTGMYTPTKRVYYCNGVEMGEGDTCTGIGAVLTWKDL